MERLGRTLLFCVLDTETTGLDPDYHEVIQIAAIMCDQYMDEIGRTSFRIQPQWIERASRKALEINGYHPRTWNPKFYTHKKALKYLNSFIGKYSDSTDEIVLVGQNIKFDIDFITAAYNREGVLYPFSYTSFDLIDVVKIWEKDNDRRLKSRSLKYLSEFTGCINTNPHDAEADAETTLDILKWFIEDFKRGSNNARRSVRKCTKVKV